MRYGKRWIFLLTAVLSLAALLLWRWEPETRLTREEQDIPILIQAAGDRKTEQIACWTDGSGKYYLFLPAYADLSRTQLLLKTGAEGTLNGQPLQNGISCSSFRLGEGYALEYGWEGERVQGELFFLQSSQIPSVHIRTQSGNMDYIHEEKGNAESGTIHIYMPDGTVDFAGNLKEINGRGNGTWGLDKKPYSFMLTTQADLLEMGTAQRWVLLANYVDASQIRNKLVYDYAAEAGMPYSPESQWVDLYLNGEYAGLYQLCERNEIHPQRVALEETDSFLVSTDWIWRMETRSYEHFTTDSSFSLRVRHNSLETTEALAALWQGAENAILAEDGIDPVTGKDWKEWIDAESWAQKFLIEEIFGSLDAGAVSQFFYGSAEAGVIHAGPVWDFDLSMGNGSMWQLSRPEAFFANREKISSHLPASWFYPLYQKEEFRALVVELYRDTYRPLLETCIQETMAEYAALIRDAGEMNRLRWNLKPMEEEIRYIRDYMLERMAFLDSLWLEDGQWYTILADTADASNTVCLAVRPGENIPQLPDPAAYGAVGWYHRETGEPVDLSQPVTEDMDIYLKYPEKEKVQTGTESRIPLWTKAPAIVLGLLLPVLLCRDRMLQGRNKRKKAPQLTQK